MLTEIVYNGYGNDNDFELQADGAAVDLSPVTRMVLKLKGVDDIDSDTAPAGTIDWSAGGGLVSLSLGGLALAQNKYSAHLIVYDPSNTDGIVWGQFVLDVKTI